jgi:pyrimidine deaminase RibD-like protein
VFVAIRDPHPRNRGAGLQILLDAGIPVIEGICTTEAEHDMGPHLWRAPDPPTTDQ